MNCHKTGKAHKQTTNNTATMCFPFFVFFFKKIVGDDDDDDMPDLLDRHILDIDDEDDEEEDDDVKLCFCIPFFGFFFKKIVGSDGRTTYYSHKPHGGYYYSFRYRATRDRHLDMEATDLYVERASAPAPIVNQKKEEDHNDDEEEEEEEIAIGLTLTCEQLVKQKFNHAAKNGYIIAIDI
ncbi:MAG: hypothetical protein ACI8RD_013054 [Bacillariaceae sp.]|jgi:hypothetical protein